MNPLWELRLAKTIIEGRMSIDFLCEATAIPQSTLWAIKKRYERDPRLAVVVPLSPDEVGLDEKVVEALKGNGELAAEVVRMVEDE